MTRRDTWTRAAAFHEARCTACNGVGVVLAVIGTDEDGCPIRDAASCDVCGGSGWVVP